MSNRRCASASVRLPAAVALAVLLAWAASAEVARNPDPPTPERQRSLIYLLKQDCGSCHGMTMKGGLGAPLLPATLADKADDVLVSIILDGMPGTPMPPWRSLLSESEAAWMVKRLKKGLKE